MSRDARVSILEEIKGTHTPFKWLQCKVSASNLRPLGVQTAHQAMATMQHSQSSSLKLLGTPRLEAGEDRVHVWHDFVSCKHVLSPKLHSSLEKDGYDSNLAWLLHRASRLNAHGRREQCECVV